MNDKSLNDDVTPVTPNQKNEEPLGPEHGALRLQDVSVEKEGSDAVGSGTGT